MFDFFSGITQKIVVLITAITVSVTSIFGGNSSPIPSFTPTLTSETVITPSVPPRPAKTTSSITKSQAQNKVDASKFEVIVNSHKHKDLLEDVTLKSCAENDLECKLENSRITTIPLGGRYRFTADLTIKNVSITPFITGYQLSSCEVVRNDNKTNFTFYSSSEFEKGILPGESILVKINSGFGGIEYDSSGNKVLPGKDLKVKSCKLDVNTKGGFTRGSKTLQFKD